MLVKTTKLPSRKMMDRDTFWVVLVCNFHTCGSGRARIATSVRILGTEIARNVA
jgi:hypothetical protein